MGTIGQAELPQAGNDTIKKGKTHSKTLPRALPSLVSSFSASVFIFASSGMEFAKVCSHC